MIIRSRERNSSNSIRTLDTHVLLDHETLYFTNLSITFQSTIKIKLGIERYYIRISRCIIYGTNVYFSTHHTIELTLQHVFQSLTVHLRMEDKTVRYVSEPKVP